MPSITWLVLTGLPTGIGNKGNRVSHKHKSIEVTDCTPVSTAFSAHSTITTSLSHVGFAASAHKTITTTTYSDYTLSTILSVAPVYYQFNRPDIHEDER